MTVPLKTVRTCVARLFFAAAILGAGLTSASHAQGNPFAPGWDLKPEASNIRFQSVKHVLAKNDVVVEGSSFATFSGSIEENGKASVKVLLDSVDTKVDLRNVRMRFLFFETFKFPEAVISLSLTPAMVADLPTVRRKVLKVPYDFTLHGVTRRFESDVVISLLSDGVVSVASDAPITIPVADFGLDENVRKLEETFGGITIVPSATVTFDFLFARRGGGSATVASQVTAPQEEAKPASAALEAEGDFSLEACKGRFEILSETGNIYFRVGSARLDRESIPLLDSVVDIVRRCPGLNIEISGHTDSDGSAAANQRLSEARARSVADFLARKGIAGNRMHPVGYGEDRPVKPNDTPYNKSRNRRIEFAVIGG
ncbi:MAG: OmpA family protein [Paracoccaceae bacterium]